MVASAIVDGASVIVGIRNVKSNLTLMGDSSLIKESSIQDSSNEDFIHFRGVSFKSFVKIRFAPFIKRIRTAC